MTPPLAQKKLTLPQDFTFLIFSIIPLFDVVVLTVKEKFTIPMLIKKNLKSNEREVKHFFLGPL